jgi:phospholipase/carboxylesterase
LETYLIAGTNDQIFSAAESMELQSLLEKANAKVIVHWENRGHQLTREEVEMAAKWYQTLK